MEDKKFYTYVYIDPRKPGKFVYGDYQFDYEPFYIGKGSNRRSSDWKRMAENFLQNKKISDNCIINVIVEILKENLEPIIIKYKKEILEQEAFNLEVEMIKSIGRVNLNTGPLLNLTAGGDGTSGYTHTVSARLRMAKSKMGKNNPMKRPEIQEKSRKSHLGHTPWNKGRTKENDKIVASMAENKRGRTKETHEYIARAAEKLKGRTSWIFGKTKENDPRVVKYSKKLRGKIPWNKGLTKETDGRMTKIAEKRRGIQLRKETKEKISLSLQNKKFSEKHKENLKIAWKKRK